MKNESERYYSPQVTHIESVYQMSPNYFKQYWNHVIQKLKSHKVTSGRNRENKSHISVGDWAFQLVLHTCEILSNHLIIFGIYVMGHIRLYNTGKEPVN